MLKVILERYFNEHSWTLIRDEFEDGWRVSDDEITAGEVITFGPLVRLRSFSSATTIACTLRLSSCWTLNLTLLSETAYKYLAPQLPLVHPHRGLPLGRLGSPYNFHHQVELLSTVITLYYYEDFFPAATSRRTNNLSIILEFLDSLCRKLPLSEYEALHRVSFNDGLPAGPSLSSGLSHIDITLTNFGDTSLPTVMYWTDASCTVMPLASAVLLLEVAVLVHCKLWTLTRYSEYRSSETLVPQVPLRSSTISPHHSIIPVLPSGHFID